MLKCNYCVHGTNFVSFCYRETWMEQFSVLDPHEKSGMVQKKYNAGDKKCFPFAFWKVLNGFIRIQASLVSSHLTTTCTPCTAPPPRRRQRCGHHYHAARLDDEVHHTAVTHVHHYVSNPYAIAFVSQAHKTILA